MLRYEVMEWVLAYRNTDSPRRRLSEEEELDLCPGYAHWRR